MSGQNPYDPSDGKLLKGFKLIRLDNTDVCRFGFKSEGTQRKHDNPQKMESTSECISSPVSACVGLSRGDMAPYGSGW